MYQERKPMIRLDDENDEQQREDEASDDSSEYHVTVPGGRISEFISKGGVTYQRCGGGYRRMPKRSS